jgi:hypothetical protein
MSEEDRQRLLEEIAQSFDEPGGAEVDSDLLREGKSRAWPFRPGVERHLGSRGTTG